MKKTISLILAAVMILAAFALTGCSSGKGKSPDDIKKAGKLIVYTEAGFAPYEFIYNNEIVGVDVEIMKEVAKKLGVKVEVSDVDFNTICASVKSGKADVGAAGITINDDRKLSVDFSMPYSTTEQYIIVAENNDTIKTLEDLSGKKIGVQEGTTSDSAVNKLISDKVVTDTVVTGYKSPAIAAASVPNKIDAVVTDKLTAELIVKNNSGLKTFKLVDKSGNPIAEIEEYGIAVAKGNSELLAVINEVIQELKNNGSIEKWVEDYSALANSGESNS
jgi:ABC-type amino acid transport substrate-binding protein